MKTICLIRHGKSGKKNNPDIPDILRPLKKRGKRFVIADFNGGLRPDKWPDGTTNAQRNRPL